MNFKKRVEKLERKNQDEIEYELIWDDSDLPPDFDKSKIIQLRWYDDIDKGTRDE